MKSTNVNGIEDTKDVDSYSVVESSKVDYDEHQLDCNNEKNDLIWLSKENYKIKM